MKDSVLSRSQILDVIRLGTLEQEIDVIKGLKVKFRLLTKGQVDASNEAVSRRMASKGLNALDAVTRLPIQEEEQLAVAILEMNGISMTYDQNLEVLQQVKSQVFALIWDAYQNVGYYNQMQLERMVAEVKNSSRSQAPEPSGTSSSDSQTPPGSTGSANAETSSPSSSSSG